MAALDPSCRILVVSHSTNTAFNLISQIVKNDHLQSRQEISQLIPWTIKNKYYHADVHFQIQDLASWSSFHSSESLPAVIFVWSNVSDLMYRTYAQEISKDLKDTEVEVCLGVRLHDPEPIPWSDEDEDEEDDTDEFMASQGFELICIGHRETSDLPGLPRLLDALSTIMWPTMVQSSSSQTFPELLSSLNDSKSSYDLESALPTIEIQDHNSTRNQMMDLERWLQEDDDLRPDIYDRDETAASPTNLEDANSQTALAFDDDFTAFVSAPVQKTSRASTPESSGVDDEFLHSRAAWSSLRSVSDLGDADDELIPSQEEVEETSQRLFASSSGTNRPIDLSRVMGVLQTMKEEIAEMDDDDQRRKAAAKVAMSLVYGLNEN